MTILFIVQLFSIFISSFQERKIDSYLSMNLESNGINMPYKFLKPNYKTKKDVPLIVFLHGSGERGIDNNRQLIHGGKFFLEATENKIFNSYVVFPQCNKNFRWSSHYTDPWIEDHDSNKNKMSLYGYMVVKLIEHLIKEYNIDKDKIYLVGLSMGGYGIFDLTSKRPDLFAAAVPICGGANLNILQNAVNIPHWIFHGELDKVVPVDKSRKAFEFLINKNPNHRYTEYKNTFHNSWDKAFDDGQFMDWLFSISK